MIPWASIAPAAAAFVLVAFVVLYGASHPTPRPSRPSRLTPVASVYLLAYIVALGVAGYAVLLMVELVFSVWLLGDGDSFREAVWGGPFMFVVAVPVFVLLTWLEGRLRG